MFVLISRWEIGMQLSLRNMWIQPETKYWQLIQNSAHPLACIHICLPGLSLTVSLLHYWNLDSQTLKTAVILVYFVSVLEIIMYRANIGELW